MSEKDARIKALVDEFGLDPLDAALAVAISDGRLPDGDMIETDEPPVIESQELPGAWSESSPSATLKEM